MRRGNREELWAFWRMAIELHADSGLSVAEFCRHENLHPASFYSWRRKLAAACDDTVGDEANHSFPSVQFASVEIVDDRQPSDINEQEPIEVVAANGLVLRVPNRASSDNVQRVLRLMCDVS